MSGASCSATASRAVEVRRQIASLDSQRSASVAQRDAGKAQREALAAQLDIARRLLRLDSTDLANEGGLEWATATGYISVWETLHRADEALIDAEAPSAVIGEHSYAEPTSPGQKPILSIHRLSRGTGKPWP